MMTVVGICEACRIKPVEVVDSDDDLEQPYLVCLACDHRLQTCSLRPLEWFNLAAIHGPNKFLLHDDFYDDWGNAEQPNELVLDGEKFPAPTLEAIEGDMERLVDYANTRYYITEHDSVLHQLKIFDLDVLLHSLQRRVSSANNLAITGCAFEICAFVVKGQAADWIREQWSCRDWPNYDPSTFISLSEAVAASLPFDEGWDKVASSLENLSVTLLDTCCRAFIPFHSTKTLDWIEKNESKILSDSWGQVAAYSHFSWPRAERWLLMGQPLSRRALAALLSCYHLNVTIPKGPAPGLEDAASVEYMVAALDSYLASDNIPMVRRRVEAIQAHWRSEHATA